MSAAGRALRVGVDIGGTFTDFVLIGSDGSVETTKVLTTPDEPSRAVFAGLDALVDGAARTQVEGFAHATTLATNAITERKGAGTALLTTRGHRDALIIGRSYRYDMQDLFIDLPQPLVARTRIVEVDERIDADGGIVTALDEAAVAAAVDALVEDGVEAVAIGFLHSYANPLHEQRAAALVRERAPHLRVSLSSEIAPFIGEFERFSTTVANAYVQPIVQRYLGDLVAGLRAHEVAAPVVIMLSNGGLTDAETAGAMPVRMVESGPAAGVMGAASFVRRLGLDSCLVFDVGGTTAKGAAILDGHAPLAFDLEVARLDRFKKGSGLPLKTPSVDLIEIGAGGGSLAAVDALRRIRVGPESASAVPGPAAYGKGGERATVTDADLVLGYLNAGRFASGRFTLDEERARAAVRADVAEPLGLEPAAAAQGVHAVVNDNMASAIRIHCVERGVDVRGLPMIAFGGCGPVHACGVAELLGTDTVVVPKAASVFSALGLLVTPPAFESARTAQSTLADLDWTRVNALYDEMEAAAAERLRAAAGDGARLRRRRFAEMRYAGQHREIAIELPLEPLGPSHLDALRAAFGTAYERVYSEQISGLEIEAVTWRSAVEVPGAAAAEPLPLEELVVLPAPAGEPARMYFDGAWVDATAYTWAELEPGSRCSGPCRVEGLDTTVVVRPGWTVEVLPEQHLRLRLKEDR